MKTFLRVVLLLTALANLNCLLAAEARITVHAGQVVHPASRFLTGACLEDVNHEVYGGIDSQMIFGESFAEPVAQPSLKGFKVYGGRWIPTAAGTLHAAVGEGPKLVCKEKLTGDVEVSVQLFFNQNAGGNAGLILKVGSAGNGADNFDGYEVALEPAGALVLGRHRHNWELIRRAPCVVPLNQWVTLRVKMSGKTLEIFINDRSTIQYEDTEHPLPDGALGLRTWQCEGQFRNLNVIADGMRRDIPFVYAEKDGWGDGVSGMWRAFRRGTAQGHFSIESQAPFVGAQSQRIIFTGETGEMGIENQSLNRWGMNFVEGNRYEGYVWVRAAASTELFVSLESRDGAAVYAEKRLKLTAGDWQRLDFTLKPNGTDKFGRFALKLKQPGDVTIGYAFLQPGAWGRFKGLPVRKDVAEGLINQGITVLRYGGCMVNAAEYRWKKMIGPRAQRPPYTGWWYPHSSNGWGIFDCLNFCEAAGFLAVPDVNINETPQDMADFIEYVNGPKDSEWGRQRAQAGHPKPYQLKYLQLGNEEQVNEDYWRKFKGIAEAVWAKDSAVILIVGDFCYHQKIEDPFNFSGADGRITSLSAQQKILRLAKQHNREVWFDVHISTEGPRPDFGGTFSYIDALEKLAEGAKHRVVIFEFNAGNHSQRRALGNAIAINTVERDGRIPVALSANCLQPDGQNDNDWNQGLLFLNPAQVWLQPPGYVTQMISRNHQPLQVKCEVQSPEGNLEVSAKRSEDGQTLVLQVVNVADEPTTTALDFSGFIPRHASAQVQILEGALNARNTAENPEAIKPSTTEWRHEIKAGRTTYTFPARSITVMRF